MKKRAKYTEAEVADYWLTHDSTVEIDWTKPGVRLKFDPAVRSVIDPETRAIVHKRSPSIQKNSKCHI